MSSGFPHSEISGSKLTYSSPEHIGVSAVLLRLLVPRHPPCALSNLTFKIGFRYTAHCVVSSVVQSVTYLSTLLPSLHRFLALLASQNPSVITTIHSDMFFIIVKKNCNKKITNVINSVDSWFVTFNVVLSSFQWTSFERSSRKMNLQNWTQNVNV